MVEFWRHDNFKKPCSVIRWLMVDTAVYPVVTAEYTIEDNNINFYFYLLMDRINTTGPHYIIYVQQ